MELQTSATVLQGVAFVLLIVSSVVFITQIVTEKYRVRNMLDEILTIILSVYLLRLQTGEFNRWYMIATVSIFVPGMVIIWAIAYIQKLKSKLEAAEKYVYNAGVEGQYEEPKEIL